MASQVYIDTNDSQLIFHNNEFQNLVEKCVIETKDKLNHHPEIIVFGRICHQQRSVGFFSDESKGYSYSGQIASSKPLTPSLKLLLENINAKFDSYYNGILINLYENGSEYIGPHSDDEKGLEPKHGVLAISYGASRTLRIRDKYTKKKILDIKTNKNKIVQMKGKFQTYFTHEVPIEKKIKENRISFTFRYHKH